MRTEPGALGLLQAMLQLRPEMRISAADALRHPYFQGMANVMGPPRAVTQQHAAQMMPPPPVPQQQAGAYGQMGSGHGGYVGVGQGGY